MYMMYIYAYHTYIIPHIIIYMRLFHGLLKKHNIPLINNVVALYAILPLRVLDYNTSLKEYHWLHVGMFFQETSWQRSWGKRLYNIMAATLSVWKKGPHLYCFIGYWVCTFCPEKLTSKYCTGTGWGIIVELPKYWSVIDSLKHN